MAAVPRLLLLLLGTAALLPCVATLDILQAGSDILANQYLQSGNFYLVMQLDCNLVIYQGVECCSNPTWSTGTWNLGAAGDGCVASMQQDRNFVVYGFVNNVKTALWDTHTDLNNATGAYYVILGNDGSLKVMEIGSPDVIWTNVVETGGAPVPSPPVSTGAPAPSAALAPASQSASNVTFLTPESKVVAGSFLANEDVRLTLELDCNLQSRNVLGGSVVWETGSHTSQGGCELVLQKDSALLIRIQSSGAVIWKSNTKNPKNAVAQFLFLREDGTVAVISTNGEEIWSLGKTDHSPSKSLAGVIVGTTGGILGGIILLGVTLCILMQYGYFDKDQKELQLRLLDKGGRSRALTLRQLKKATNNNERLLGRGGFGPVYYGRLQDGQEVAVKVLSATSNQGKQEFFNEIELLSVVHHKFLVSLVGYCIQRKQRILVYEYMSGGDVQNRLHGETASTDPLSWSQRKNIILQVAEGIQYLHEGCKPAIIHRDIKTNNILLDERMVAKVADFGLSKLLDVDRDDATHITTVVKGTTGYLDPEYYVSLKLTEKSDVYAYGVLLMQIITGSSLLDSVDNMYIVQKVRLAWKSKELDNLADPNLGGNYDHKELSGLVKLSLWCVKRSSSDRPSMSEVVHELREIGLSLSGTSHPSEAVVGEDYKIETSYPLQTESSSSNLKNDMSDPLISAFSVSSSSGSAPGGPLLRRQWS